MYVEIEDQKSYGTEKGRELCSPFALVPPHQGNMLHPTLFWARHGMLSRDMQFFPR